MVAFEGQVEFDSQYRNRSWRNVERMTGERLELMRCKGNGVVYLANLAQHLHVMEVGSGITVDSSYVLAFDGSLGVGIVAVDSAVEVAAAGAYNLELSGSGQVVLMTSGEPLVLEVGPDKNVCCRLRRRHRLVHVPAHPAPGAHAPLPACGAAGAPPARAGRCSFCGTGHVLVQPSELLPPQARAFRGAARPVRHARQLPRGQQRLSSGTARTADASGRYDVRGARHCGRPLRILGEQRSSRLQSRARVASSSRTTDSSATAATSS